MQKLLQRIFGAGMPGRDAVARLWLENDRLCLARREAPGAERRRNVMLRWRVTTWCNYDCPYCRQPHDRAPGTHAFDLFPVHRWIEAFDRHFAGAGVNLLVTLTGGEPMLDVEKMRAFLSRLAGRNYVAGIRVDTNLSWRPSDYRDAAASGRIRLMCTFHPGRTGEDEFLKKIEDVRRLGFAIGICNYVLSPESAPRFERLAKAYFERGVPLHPNPLWDAGPGASEAVRRILETYLPERDRLLRTGIERTRGRPCLFPAVGYEMDPRGIVRVGCRGRIGRRFVTCARLPELYRSYVRCPHAVCRCLDKYSFLRGFGRNCNLDPLHSYARRLLDRYARRGRDA